MTSVRKNKSGQHDGPNSKSEQIKKENTGYHQDHSKEEHGTEYTYSNRWAVMLVLAVLLCASIMAGNRGVRIATYNTALTSGLEHYKYRAENARTAISRINADFVCLQEVWYMKDVVAVMESAKEEFPHTFSYYHTDVDKINSSATDSAACNDPIKTARVYECVMENCGMHDRSKILSCVNKLCSQLVSNLDQSCLSCLVMAGKKDYKRCFSMSFNLPGLLILSKLPLINPTRKRYFPDILLYLPRAYLQVDIPNFGRVVCTHLTATIGPYYFERLNFTSDEEQQKNEIKHLLRDLDNVKVDEQKAVIVAGDLNMGPQVLAKDVQPDFASNYDLFMKNGFQDTYIREGGDCTWCTSNPLTIDDKNCIYDHILIKGAAFGTSSKKIMTEKLTGGDFPISDHYGVIVDVQIKSYWRMLSEHALVWFYSAYNSITSVF